MATSPQNHELLKHLFALIQRQRPIFKQERTYQRVLALVLAELFVFARQTMTQLLMALGMTDQDWRAWYRVFRARRFVYDKASAIVFGETLHHVREDAVYVVGGDSTQTLRSSRKLEGSGGLRHPRTPPFMPGIMRHKQGSMAVGLCQQRQATVGLCPCAGYRPSPRNRARKPMRLAQNGKRQSLF